MSLPTRRMRTGCVVLVAMLTASGILAQSAGSAVKYKKLSAVGVKADRAFLKGRLVQVRIRAKRTVSIRLAVVRNGKIQQAWSKSSVRKGTTVLTRRLNRTPPSLKDLKLRVTATRGKVRARAFLKLNVIPVTPPPPVNSPPTAIALSSSSVAENQPAGTAVGTLSATDPNPADTLTFSLVSGAGDADNASFAIAGSALRTAASLNFEAKSSHSIRVRVSDGRGGALVKQFTITVTGANDGPTNIALSGSGVAENQAAGTTVGTLSASDEDPLDTQTFTLVSGAGDADNASFAIAGAALQTAASLDFEAKSSYSVRVRTTDSGGATFEKELTIAVTNVNEQPTDIALSSASIVEGAGVRPVGTFSTSDPDAGDTFTYALVAGTGATDNGSFQITGNTLQTNATFTFPTPAKSIRVRSTDASGLPTEKVFSIAITKQNLAPTDIALAPSTVAENQPSNTVVGTLSASDPDAGETFTFALAAGGADNASFNIAGTQLRTSASLDFESKSSYSIRVRVTDGPGAFFEENLTVTVTNVNEAPADIALSAASVAENQPAVTTVGTLSTTDPDAANTFTYTLVAGSGSTDNGQFQVTGNILQTSSSQNFEAGATRSVRVRSTDGGGLFFEEALTITITDANDAPIADDETFNGALRAVGNTVYVGDDPTDGAPDPAGPQKTITGDILAGDADEDGTGSLAVTAGTFPTNDGGSVDLQADGDFVYRPAAGTSCSDHSDFFDYTVSDQNSTKPPGTPATDVGRVTIEVQDCVWYVDASVPAGGDGRSHAPLNTLAGVAGAGGAGDADAAGHTIFLYDGSYSGGLPLEPSQPLSGQRHGLTVPDGAAGSVTLEPAVPAGSPSAITGGLALSTNNTIQGINLGNAAGPALSGTAVANAAMNTVTPGLIDNATGQAVSISGGTLDMAFSAVSSTGSAGAGIGLTNVSGTFTASGGALVNATGADVALSGGSSNFTFSGAISDDVGALVTISGETAGTKDFNGTITDQGDGDGSGISLSGNGGATVRFDGGLTLATGANAAFSATGGGTVAVTDPAGAASNTAVTTAATALNVANTSIHGDDLTFERIASNGAASGIVLNATGAGGGLVVTGTGAVNSGGVIQGSTGPGVSLTSVGGGVDLTRVSVTGGADDGVRGSTVNGFTLSNGAVTNNGGVVGEHGLDFTGLTGSVVFTTATITGNAENNLSIVNDSGTLSASVTGGTIGSNSPSIGNDGILVLGTGTGSLTLNVQGAVFTDNRGDHIQMATDASNTVTENLTVNNSTLSTSAGADPAVLGGSITFNPGGNAVTDVTITNNTIQEAFSSAITIDTPGSAVDPQPATVDATISGNTIGSAGAVDSGSESGNGISLFSNGLGDVDALIENNTIRQFANLAGIDILQNDGNGTLDATVRNNTIANPGTFALNGILVRSGLTGGTETGQTCVDIGHASNAALKNSLTGSSGAGGSTDIRVRQLSNTTVRLPGYGGAANDNAAVVSYLQGRNNPVSTPTVSATNTVGSGGGGFVTTAACTLP